MAKPSEGVHLEINANAADVTSTRLSSAAALARRHCPNSCPACPRSPAYNGFAIQSRSGADMTARAAASAFRTSIGNWS